MEMLFRKDFAEADFDKWADGFLAARFRPALDPIQLKQLHKNINSLRKLVIKAATQYTGNANKSRYDKLNLTFESIQTRLEALLAKAGKDEPMQLALIKFKKVLAKQIKADCTLLKDSYLTNTCRPYWLQWQTQ